MGIASAISDRDRRDYNEAAALLDRALGAEDPTGIEELWQRALDLALSCTNRNGQNPDFNYLVGYIYTRAPEKTEETLDRAEHFLTRALDLDSNHHLARYCLGCTLFNQKKYGRALRELDKLPHDAFVSSGQWWRVVKTYELRFCCELYLEHDLGDVQIEKAEKLKDLYMSFEDPRIAPVPAEFADCTVFLLREHAGTASVLHLSRTCARLFEHLQLGGLLHQRWPEIEVP